MQSCKINYRNQRSASDISQHARCAIGIKHIVAAVKSHYPIAAKLCGLKCRLKRGIGLRGIVTIPTTI